MSSIAPPDLEKGPRPIVEGASSDEQIPETSGDRSSEMKAKNSPILPEEKADGSPSHDPNIVTWDGPNDPCNPQNWSLHQKWAGTAIVSCFTFMSPLASSMVAPALPEISREFGIAPGSVVESLILSIFVLAYAIGPLLFGPLSEIFGRSKVLQLSNVWFLVFNIACSRAQNTGQMLAFRFLAGLGGSAPLAIGGGTVADLFTADDRGKALSIYTLAPLTGPALGPVIGGWIAQKSTWRWIFYASSIADGVIQVLGLIFLRETYAPKLMAEKTRRLRQETGNSKLRSMYLKPGAEDVYDGGPRAWAKVIFHGLALPLRMLATQPIVQVFALYQAILYGIMYLTLTTFAALWQEMYHYPVGIAGLHYLALGVGFTVGAQIGARFLDSIYKKLKERNGGVGTPEMRMPMMMLTAVALPVGLILYGWSAKYHVVWIVPDIGACIFAAGIMGSFLPIQSYLVDTYTLHAASAIGAAASFRSLAGFGFPLFANAMFRQLGLGWGNTLLAFVALSVGGPAPFVFYRYGARLRELAVGKSTPSKLVA